MLTCTYCTYSTTRSYNFKRHINIHHNQTNNIVYSNTNSNDQEVKNVCPEVKNVCLEVKNVCLENKIVSLENKNVFHNILNIIPNENDNENNIYIYCDETKKYKCNGCYKTFVKKISIKNHICKKINNPYECPKCHLVLSGRNCKSKHIKRCLIK